jgi:hypothetical protein
MTNINFERFLIDLVGPLKLRISNNNKGERGKAVPLLNSLSTMSLRLLRRKLEVSCQPHAPVAFHMEKSPQYPFDRVLGGPQNRSNDIEKRKLLLLNGLEL